MTEELRIELDLDIGKWPLIDQMDFEKAVGMTTQRAARLMVAASEDEDKAADIPAAVLAGFVWVAARKQRPGLTFEEAAGAFSADDFMAAIPEEPVPLEASPNRAQRRTTKASSGRSATTSSTPRSKSAH